MTKNNAVAVLTLFVLILAGAVYAGFQFLNTHKASPGVDAPITQSVSYFCAEDKKVVAVYGENQVTLSLDSGEVLVMPQTVSASGARYESDKMSTSTDIVFVTKGDNAHLSVNDVPTYEDCLAGVAVKEKDNITFTPASKLFSVSYPQNAFLSGGGIGFSDNWLNMSTSSGLVLVEITLPRSAYPKTNFSEGVFTLGTSADEQALAECTTGRNLGSEKGESVVLGGMPYTKFMYSDAGAGNLYETTSYRMQMQGQCYVLEYTIHTTNIGNYSPDQGIKEYDAKKVHDIFEGIVSSVKLSGTH